MSRYAWLVCEESKQMIWLGKTVSDLETGEAFFQIGEPTAPPNSENVVLTKAVMKFLAQNVGRVLRVITEEDFESVTDEDFVEIGEDEALGIGFSKYIHDFHG